MLTLTKKQKEAVNSLFSDNALRMMKKRYLVTDKKGVQEPPADMFNRVASALADVEKTYGKTAPQTKKISEDFFSVLSTKEFTPAGRTMTNAGSSTSLIANCIVLPVHDSMESIFQTLKDAALLQQAGSGLGFDFSELRPANFPTKKSRGVASGPVSFLRAYDAAFATIKQQCFAKGTRIVTRRGLVPIEEVGVGDETYTQKGWKRITEVFSNGARETLRLTLDSGFSIELTPEHEVAVIHGNAIALKKAKDLTPEDVLLMKLGDETSGTDGKREELQVVAYEKSKYTSFQLKKITQPALLDEDLAYFLGWFFADGHVSRQGIGLAIADTNREEQRVKKLAQDLFGLTPCVQKSGADKCRKVDINSLVLQKYLRVNGLLKQHAWNIEVPEKILRSPGSVQMAFIAGFFDGDGDNGKNYRLNSTSKKFVQQLQLMLLANGVGAKIKAEQGKEARWRLLYRVGIIGKDSTRQFYALTSGRSWKIKKKEGGKDFGWIFPFHPIRDLGYSWSDIKQLHDGVRSTVSCSVLSHIQQRAFLRQAETATRERIDWTGFLPVRLQSVEKAGRQEVYDFEVEDIHMINAGLYTSNSRHGANMAMMRVDHPDVLDFIRCKNKEGDIRNFNVTVTITDEFMNAVEKRPHEQWYCTFKGEKYKPRKVLRHATGAVYGSEDIDITAKELFDQLVESAWLNGEPGIAFLGTINATNPLPGLGPIAASNPCGEQFLHSYDNCNLGSLNLALFVKKGAVDWPRLKFVVKTAVRMLDNVIDLFDFPVAQVTDLARKNRRIGLGIMGFADMLYQLGIGYDSKKGYAVAEKVMEYIQREAHAMSRELAKEKGVFPNFAMSVHAKKKTNMRNAALTTVAPTGSISMMFDVSSGLEPNFALAFVKQDKDGNQYRYFNRYFENALKKMKLSQKDQDGIMNEVIEKGTVRHISALPKALRDTFVVSMDISGESHVRMQAAFQRHVDNSISKTINFPNSATQEEVGESFMLAWKLGCKSCTVYRDGSRNVQVLNIGTGERVVSTTEVPGAPVAAKKEELPIDRQRLAPRLRPAVMSGRTYKMKTGYGNLYVTVNNDEKGIPFEMFATIGKSGGFYQEQSEAITRLVSLSLRSGIKVEEVIHNLKGIRGPMPVFTETGTILSLPDALGKVLEEHVGTTARVEELIQKPENQEVLPFIKEDKMIADFGFMPGCPDCGSPLHMQEGCISCKSCGFSRCS